jgi:hypothetical protein
VSSPRLEARNDVGSLLDLGFGFYVWAAHLLVVYIGTALACVLGLGAASAGSRTAFLAGLALLTVAAAAVLVWHAARRYRTLRTTPDRRFRMSVTIGGDAIAAVAVVWQLFPILLVPVCA